ncbi:hypothetical protein CYMTET_27736, partial [Cymbomonas tetramitiformis]
MLSRSLGKWVTTSALCSRQCQDEQGDCSVHNFLSMLAMPTKRTFFTSPAAFKKAKANPSKGKPKQEKGDPTPKSNKKDKMKARQNERDAEQKRLWRLERQEVNRRMRGMRGMNGLFNNGRVVFEDADFDTRGRQHGNQDSRQRRHGNNNGRRTGGERKKEEDHGFAFYEIHDFPRYKPRSGSRLFREERELFE